MVNPSACCASHDRRQILSRTILPLQRNFREPAGLARYLPVVEYMLGAPDDLMHARSSRSR
jgi:hypothetical protein